MTHELNATAASTESIASSQTADASTISVGHALQGLRLAKGWSLDEVSTRIKFSPRQIQALEDEQWDKLPKGVSLRGLVRSYARLLETDSAAIVSSIESQVGTLTSPGIVHRPSRTVPVAVTTRDDRSGASGGWLIVIAVLLIALAAYALWQHWLPADWLPSWLSGGKP